MRFPISLLVAYLALWTGLAVHPLNRKDWLLENLLAVIAVGLLVATWRRFPLSQASCTLIFLFLCLHAVGAHYTYAEVPYERWGQDLFGLSLNGLFGWQRNNFDRVVHFAYGLLLAWPVRERILRANELQGAWSYLLPLNLAMSTSLLYELIEWGAANVVGGDLGMAYLGTQGDIWDAHKDMAFASLGAAVAMGITLAVNLRNGTAGTNKQSGGTASH